MSAAENARHVEEMVLRHAPPAAVVLRAMIGVHHALHLIECVDFAPFVVRYLLDLTFVLDEGQVMNDVVFFVNEIQGILRRPELLRNRSHVIGQKSSDFHGREFTPAAGWQITEMQSADLDAVKLEHTHSESLKHPANLPLAPLAESHAIGAFTPREQFESSRYSVFKVNACGQALHGTGRQRRIALDLVGLAHLVTRVHQAVRQVSVVGQKQQSGAGRKAQVRERSSRFRVRCGRC
jgi:hypothetical protein